MGVLFAVVFVAGWAVVIGVVIFLLDVIRRLVRTAESNAEARMRQAQALETLARRWESTSAPRE